MCIHSVNFGKFYEEFCGWEIPPSVANSYPRAETGVPAVPLHDLFKQAGFISNDSKQYQLGVGLFIYLLLQY